MIFIWMHGYFKPPLVHGCSKEPRLSWDRESMTHLNPSVITGNVVIRWVCGLNSRKRLREADRYNLPQSISSSMHGPNGLFPASKGRIATCWCQLLALIRVIGPILCRYLLVLILLSLTSGLFLKQLLCNNIMGIAIYSRPHRAEGNLTTRKTHPETALNGEQMTVVKLATFLPRTSLNPFVRHKRSIVVLPFLTLHIIQGEPQALFGDGGKTLPSHVTSSSICSDWLFRVESFRASFESDHEEAASYNNPEPNVDIRFDELT